MQNRDEINTTVRQLLAQALNSAVRADELEDQIYMGNAAGFDSSKLLEFILALEEKFDFVVPDEDLVLENFDSISKISAYVASKTRAAPDVSCQS